MTTQLQLDFLQKALAHAELAQVPYAEYWVAESALESAWGNSKLAREGNNLFGEKVSTNWTGEVLEIPTDEYLHGAWTTEMARWKKFPSWKESFESRLATLRRLAPQYPHYAAALAAPDGRTFVQEVSKSWSTDPLRADKVLIIHAAHFTNGQIV